MPIFQVQIQLKSQVNIQFNRAVIRSHDISVYLSIDKLVLQTLRCEKIVDTPTCILLPCLARDCITLEKVEKEPSSYVLPEFTEHVEGVANWFQQVGSLDLDAPMEFPEGYYNVNDSLDELSHNEEAFAIVTKAVKLTTNFSIEPGVGMWDMLKKMSPKVMCEMMPDSSLGDKFLNSINAQLIKIKK